MMALNLTRRNDLRGVGVSCVSTKQTPMVQLLQRTITNTYIRFRYVYYLS